MSNNKKSMLAIGLMSGTSLDGIDGAIVEIKPDFSCNFIEGHSINYSAQMQAKIKKLFSYRISPKFLCEMNFLIGEYFAKCAMELINKTKLNPDLIGSHGITLYHNPLNKNFENFSLKSTLQIGEGAVIAERTGITTICDFRVQDIAAGGEGAPLVPFADKILFGNSSINRAILNLGGIANVTVLSTNCDIFAFDTGPANMLIDGAMRKLFNKNFDKNGKIAKLGKINNNLLQKLMQNKYLYISPPKSTGREIFGEKYLEKILSTTNDTPENIIATLTMFTAKSIKQAFTDFIYPKSTIKEIILGGGGAYNKTLKENLSKEFEPETKIKTHEDYGISNKYKEAIAFALLAYCTFHNIPNNIKTATGAVKEVILGKIIRKV